MRKIRLFISKFIRTAKQNTNCKSIMNQTSYKAEEIPIDQIPLPYGQSILSVTRYSIK